jgi:ABC-type antimicrobial peptide transport system ATPase subunit
VLPVWRVVVSSIQCAVRDHPHIAAGELGLCLMQQVATQEGRGICGQTDRLSACACACGCKSAAELHILTEQHHPAAQAVIWPVPCHCDSDALMHLYNPWQPTSHTHTTTYLVFGAGRQGPAGQSNQARCACAI